MQSRILLVTGLAVVVAVFAAGMVGGSRNDPIWSNGNCAMKPTAMLNKGELGSSFIITSDSVQAIPPVGFRHNDSFKTFLGGRIAGFLSSAALAPQYKAEQDARWIASNMKPGRIPVLPLAGRVVTDNPGPLEVYQANWACRSYTDASAFLSDVAGSKVTGRSMRSSLNLHDVAEGEAWIFPSASSDSERSLDVDFRVAGAVVQLGIRGGAELKEAYGQSLFGLARDHLRFACSI